MKNSLKIKAILKCINDLKDYYATCGNDDDFKNLEIFKKELEIIAKK